MGKFWRVNKMISFVKSYEEKDSSGFGDCIMLGVGCTKAHQPHPLPWRSPSLIWCLWRNRTEQILLRPRWTQEVCSSAGHRLSLCRPLPLAKH